MRPPKNLQSIVHYVVNELLRELRSFLYKITKPSKTDATIIPAIADTVCPPIAFRGCANGLLGTEYKRTAAAPNDPIKKGLSTKEVKTYTWSIDIVAENILILKSNIFKTNSNEGSDKMKK
jgi:hypothetical protein